MASTYRSELYQNYVTAQFPEWSCVDKPADEIWRKAALHRIRQWLPEHKNAKCLDLGCGTGQLLLALRDAGYMDVSGVDLGPEAVAIACQRGLNVTLADVKDFLSQTEDSFDVVCAFDLVEHFRKDELFELLRLIQRRLTPGGTFIFQTPNALSPWAAHYRYGDLTHELMLSQHSAEAVLKLTGFEGVVVREVGPFVHGLSSGLRLIVWKLLWVLCALWNLAETGALHGGVYTRNMLVKAERRAR